MIKTNRLGRDTINVSTTEGAFLDSLYTASAAATKVRFRILIAALYLANLSVQHPVPPFIALLLTCHGWPII